MYLLRGVSPADSALDNHFWVAFSRRICGGSIALITGSHAFSVDSLTPETTGIAARNGTSILSACELREKTGAPYSAQLYTRASAVVLRSAVFSPQEVLASFRNKFTLNCPLWTVFVQSCQYVRERSKVIPRYVGFWSTGWIDPSTNMLGVQSALTVLRWNTFATILLIFIFKYHGSSDPIV